MRTRLWLVALLMAIPAGMVRADEEKVPLDKLPKPVADAVRKRFPKLDMKEASKEITEDKKTVYEVSLKDGTKKIDVTLTPEGAIVMVEKEITRNDLPKAVAASIDAKYPGANYKICEELFPVKDGKEKLDSYEVLLETKDKKIIEVVVSPNGKITKIEEKKPDDK